MKLKTVMISMMVEGTTELGLEMRRVICMVCANLGPVFDISIVIIQKGIYS
jgi:hypothetical protein